MIAKKILMLVLGQIKVGSLQVEFPDGTVYRTSPDATPSAQIVLHNWRVVRRLLVKGDMAIAESYMDGDWSSDTLPQLIDLGLANLDAFQPNRFTAGLIKFVGHLRHKRNANTLEGSRRNIAFHYDLGNDFYKEWLDPSMTYSSALFDENETDMDVAQLRKYRSLADSLGLKPGDRVLEIGCGWGGFAEVAAREYGVNVLGLTLSEEQKRYADARMQRAGLATQVEIRLQDYRHVRGEFDKIVSIEMFEAVGEENWPVYFEVLNQRLTPGGRAALQIITIDHGLFQTYRRRIDFIQRYIFPGGMLPSHEALASAIDGEGLTLERRAFFGLSYAKTLAQWRERFVAAWPRIAKQGFDQRFRRMWMFYLCYCEGGFRTGRIDVGHFLISKSDGFRNTLPTAEFDKRAVVA